MDIHVHIHTGKLQVLDVGLNKPFKDSVEDAYDNWFLVNRRIKPDRILPSCGMDSFCVDQFTAVYGIEHMAESWAANDR